MNFVQLITINANVIDLNKTETSPVARNKKKECSRNPNRKMHVCIFCKKEFQRLAEHLVRRHKNEDKVKDIISTEDKQEKLWKWKTLRQQGDHIFNVMETPGERKVVKAPTRASDTNKYFTCSVCFARLRTCSRFEHRLVCKDVFQRNGDTSFKDVREDIFTGMPESLINKIRKSSHVNGFLKQTSEAGEADKSFRNVCKDLIYLEEEMQRTTGQNRPLSRFLTSVHVDAFIRVIRDMAGQVKYGLGKVIMRYPFRVQRVCRVITRFCKYLTAYYSKQNLDMDLAEITKFLNAFQIDSDKILQKPARKSIRIKQLLTPKTLPKTSDVKMFVRKLKEETPKLMNALREDRNRRTWRTLAENVLCRLTVFNRRRGGGVEKMKISDYAKTEDRLKTVTEESTYNLSPEEKEFLKSVKVVEILHKCDNVVPIYITKELQGPMDMLLEYRKYADDVHEKNDYFFAAGKKSLSPIRGVKVLERYRQILPEGVKKNFTATTLRKHGATVAQVLDLTLQDKEEWAAHMGHSVQVHDKYYKMSEEVSSVLKTGRILTALDEGLIKHYKGKRVSQIPLRTDGVEAATSGVSQRQARVVSSPEESGEKEPAPRTAEAWTNTPREDLGDEAETPEMGSVSSDEAEAGVGATSTPPTRKGLTLYASAMPSRAILLRERTASGEFGKTYVQLALNLPGMKTSVAGAHHTAASTSSEADELAKSGRDENIIASTLGFGSSGEQPGTSGPSSGGFTRTGTNEALGNVRFADSDQTEKHTTRVFSTESAEESEEDDRAEGAILLKSFIPRLQGTCSTFLVAVTPSLTEKEGATASLSGDASAFNALASAGASQSSENAGGFQTPGGTTLVPELHGEPCVVVTVSSDKDTKICPIGSPITAITIPREALLPYLKVHPTSQTSVPQGENLGAGETPGNVTSSTSSGEPYDPLTAKYMSYLDRYLSTYNEIKRPVRRRYQRKQPPPQPKTSTKSHKKSSDLYGIEKRKKKKKKKDKDKDKENRKHRDKEDKENRKHRDKEKKKHKDKDKEKEDKENRKHRDKEDKENRKHRDKEDKENRKHRDKEDKENRKHRDKEDKENRKHRDKEDKENRKHRDKEDKENKKHKEKKKHRDKKEKEKDKDKETERVKDKHRDKETGKVIDKDRDNELDDGKKKKTKKTKDSEGIAQVLKEQDKDKSLEITKEKEVPKDYPVTINDLPEDKTEPPKEKEVPKEVEPEKESNQAQSSIAESSKQIAPPRKTLPPKKDYPKDQYYARPGTSKDNLSPRDYSDDRYFRRTHVLRGRVYAQEDSSDDDFNVSGGQIDINKEREMARIFYNDNGTFDLNKCNQYLMLRDPMSYGSGCENQKELAHEFSDDDSFGFEGCSQLLKGRALREGFSDEDSIGFNRNILIPIVPDVPEIVEPETRSYEPEKTTEIPKEIELPKAVEPETRHSVIERSSVIVRAKELPKETNTESISQPQSEKPTDVPKEKEVPKEVAPENKDSVNANKADTPLSGPTPLQLSREEHMLKRDYLGYMGMKWPANIVTVKDAPCAYVRKKPLVTKVKPKPTPTPAPAPKPKPKPKPKAKPKRRKGTRWSRKKTTRKPARKPTPVVEPEQPPEPVPAPAPVPTVVSQYDLDKYLPPTKRRLRSYRAEFENAKKLEESANAAKATETPQVDNTASATPGITSAETRPASAISGLASAETYPASAIPGLTSAETHPASTISGLASAIPGISSAETYPASTIPGITSAETYPASTISVISSAVTLPTSAIPGFVSAGNELQEIIGTAEATEWPQVDDSTPVIFESESGVFEHASGVFEPAGTIYQPASGIFDPSNTIFEPAGTIYQPASGIFEPTRGIFDPASTIFGPAGTIYQPASGIYEPASTRNDLQENIGTAQTIELLQVDTSASARLEPERDGTSLKRRLESSAEGNAENAQEEGSSPAKKKKKKDGRKKKKRRRRYTICQNTSVDVPAGDNQTEQVRCVIRLKRQKSDESKSDDSNKVSSG